MTVTVSRLEADRRNGRYELSADVFCDGRTRKLRFACAGDHPRLDDATPSLDPFLVSMLIPAMERGEDLVIEGDVDEELLASSRGIAQLALAHVDRRWRRVRVHAAPRRETRQPDYSRGAALGMSCGVDSLFSHRLFSDSAATPEQLRVRTMLHNNVGAHITDATFERHRDNARRYAERSGASFVSVEANLDDFHRCRFVQSHTMRNLGAALAVEHLFHTLLYSSTHHFGAGRSSSRFAGISAVEFNLLRSLSTRTSDFRAAGAEWSRFEKFEALFDDPVALRFLTVCTRETPKQGKLNCGRCTKCAPVLVQAEAFGILDRLADSFDLDAYRASRATAWFRLLRHSIGDRRRDSDRVVLDALLQRNLPVPWWVRLFRPLVAAAAREGRLPPGFATELPPAPSRQRKDG
jgi:hypothetical protein